MPVVDLPARLRELVGDNHVVTDPDVVAPYAQDWTRQWHGKPLAVVRPGTADEVADVVRACASEGVPLVPQGGNTGLVGAGVPQDGEVVLSLLRLNSIGAVDRLGQTVAAGAGATLADVQQVARAVGLDVGIDFPARDSATLGGIASTNAGSERMLRNGATRAQVIGLEAVMADGSVLRRMSGLSKDNTGYDLVQLLVGSEGTLGVITAVELKLVAAAGPGVTTLVAIKTIDDALLVMDAVRQRFQGLEAVEYFHDDGLQLVLRHSQLSSPFDRPHPLYLLLDVAADEGTAEDLADLLSQLDVVRDVVFASRSADRRRLWELREAHAEAITAEGVPVSLDVALPLRNLARFEQELPNVVRAVARRAVPILFGHLAEGSVHVNLLAATEQDVDGLVTEAVLELVASLDGSISAEHGIGLAKRDWVQLTRNSADLAAMRAIKNALDPVGVLSPGRVLAPERYQA
jgi:FAD/FMN-containing dehydrogenase